MEDTTPEQNKNQNNTMNASLGIPINYPDNEIHPTAIIGKDVVLGRGNKIGAYCVIIGKTQIGNNNTFESFCVIGSEPEHKGYFGKPNKGVFIGCDNIIREYVTINAGCERTTRLTNNCIMLRGSHLGHDVMVENNVTISCNVLVGGHSIIGSGANLGLGAILHQFSEIGRFAMIGMGTIVTKKSNIQCFGTYVGNPAKYIKENDYQKLKFSGIEVNLICESWDNFVTNFKE